MKKLPAGIDKGAVAAAQAELPGVAQTWASALAAFDAGDVIKGVDKAIQVRTSVDALSKTFLPTATAASPPRSRRPPRRGPVPIYEFYCPDCHRVMSFLSRAVDTKRQPACPKCGRAALTRRVSSFAISKGRKEEAEGAGRSPGGLDEARLEKAMEALAGDMEHINEDDPRQSAQLMRKLLEATGAPANRPWKRP